MKLNVGRDLFVCVKCVLAVPVCKERFQEIFLHIRK